MPRRLSNNNDRPNGASLRRRLAQSASIEEALEDLAEIAAEKGELSADQILLANSVSAAEAL